MKENKNKYRAYLAIALTAFIISPIDDVIVAALFGTTVFGFGSVPFYIFMLASSTVSVIFWRRRKHRKEPNSQHTCPSLTNGFRRKALNAMA